MINKFVIFIKKTVVVIVILIILYPIPSFSQNNNDSETKSFRFGGTAGLPGYVNLGLGLDFHPMSSVYFFASVLSVAHSVIPDNDYSKIFIFQMNLDYHLVKFDVFKVSPSLALGIYEIDTIDSKSDFDTKSELLYCGPAIHLLVWNFFAEAGYGYSLYEESYEPMHEFYNMTALVQLGYLHEF
jgi:hypothetical protein